MNIVEMRKGKLPDGSTRKNATVQIEVAFTRNEL